jgi:ankyrin repeat protein
VFASDPLKLLLTLGADLTRTDTTYGNTCLHWAAMQSNHSALTQLLNQTSINVGVTNRDDETALDIARRRSDNWQIERLEAAAKAQGLMPTSRLEMLQYNEVNMFHLVTVAYYNILDCRFGITDR